MSRSLLAVLALVAATDAFSVRPPPSKLHDAMGRLRSVHLQHGITTTRVRALRSSSSEAEGDASGDGDGAAGALRRPPAPPSFGEIRRFALPALALWLGGPILSLIDTSAVGLSARVGAGAQEIASLGPATTFCDGTLYLFAFLNVATTNLYAATAAIPDDDARAREREAVVRRALKVSLVCSLALLALLLSPLGAAPLLRLYVGGGDAAGPILAPATAYVRLRSLALPAALVGNCLQAALLGAQDSVTPLLATLVSAVVNVAGDALLVVKLRLGVPGAAAATAFAAWAGTATLLGAARRELVPRGGFFGRGGKGGGGEGADGEAEYKIPVSKFLGFAAPVLTLILGKLACFGFMTHVAAALGEVPLAAHQLTLATYFFLQPACEVLSQTCQTFLPKYYVGLADATAMVEEGGDGAAALANRAKALANRDEWSAAADALAARLLRLCLAAGASVAALGALVLGAGTGMFTRDAAVAAAVRPLAAPLALATLLTGPVCAGEGVLLARRQLGFLAGVYVASTALLPAVLLRIKRTQGPVVAVWATYAAFQCVRAAAFNGRIWLPKLAERVRRGRPRRDE